MQKSEDSAAGKDSLSLRLRRHFRSGSLLRLFLLQSLVISLTVLLIFLCVFVYAYRMNRKAVFENTRTILSIYDENLSQDLTNDISLLYKNIFDDTDIPSLALSSSKVDQQKIIAKVRNYLENHLTNQTSLAGAFVYLADNDIFISRVRTSPYSEINPYSSGSDTITGYFRDVQKEGQLSSICSGWQIIPNDTGEYYYLLRVIASGKNCLGNWYFLKDLTDLDYMRNLGAFTSFLSPEGVPYSTQFPSVTEEEVMRSLDSPIFLKTDDGMRAVLISIRLSYCSCYLSTLIPIKSFLPGFRPYWILLFFMVLCLFLLILFIIRASSRILTLPEKTMEPVLRSISEGQFDRILELPEDSYDETRSIYAAYVRMADEIRRLEKDVYEEQLKKRDFELKYLKNQVAPHFLINCLNTIFVSAQLPDNQEVTNNLITTLTDHLRYTLTEQTTTSLGEEAEYLENYMKLTQFRFPGCLTYSIDIPDDIRDTTVFPLILLTLSENSIKTGLVMGEPFFIGVKAEAYEKDGVRWVHLSHTDSGTGVSEELLEKFNNILHHFEVTDKGTGVGLYNTVSRLKLILGEEASIRFRNETDMGLCVEYDIPYSSYFPFSDIHPNHEKR